MKLVPDQGAELLPMSALLRYHGERLPDGSPALTYGAETVSWRELEERSNRRARQYLAMGVKPGDLVTLALPNGVMFFECSFAVWKVGGIPNIVSARMPPGEVRAILELVKPSLVVSALGEELAGWRVLSPSTTTDGFAADPLPDQIAPYWKATTTGGSTGRPKVIMTHFPSAWSPTLAPEWLAPGETAMVPGPLHQNGPFLGAHIPLFVGSHTVGLERFDAEATLREVERHRVGSLNLVPTMMSRIWALGRETRERYDLSSLRIVVHYAAPMPHQLKLDWIDWLGPERIFEVYSGTEAQGATAITGTEWLRKRGSVGRAIPGWSISIRDEAGNEVPTGEYGQVGFRSETGGGAMFHYLGAETKVDEVGWATIGDIGRVDEDGYLFLGDRRTDMILRGGENVYPAEVEGNLESHPAIATAVVVGLPDEDLGQRVHAIINCEPGETASPAELDDYMKSRLARYKVPQSYEFVDEPLRDGETGKAQRGVLRDRRKQWLEEGREFRLRV